MALIAVGSAEGRTSQGFMSRLTNSLLAVVMALGYLVATLGVTSVVMTAGASTAQARRRGRGRRPSPASTGRRRSSGCSATATASATWGPPV